MCYATKINYYYCSFLHTHKNTNTKTHFSPNVLPVRFNPEITSVRTVPKPVPKNAQPRATLRFYSSHIHKSSHLQIAAPAAGGTPVPRKRKNPPKNARTHLGPPALRQHGPPNNTHVYACAHAPCICPEMGICIVEHTHKQRVYVYGL